MKPFTPNMNDEELDGLFRQAAEQHALRRNEESDTGRKALLWGRLSRELDPPKSSKRGYLFIPLLLVASGIIWLLYPPSGANRAKPVVMEQASNPAISATNNHKIADQGEKEIQYPAGTSSSNTKEREKAQPTLKIMQPPAVSRQQKKAIRTERTYSSQSSFTKTGISGSLRGNPLPVSSFPYFSEMPLQNLPVTTKELSITMPDYLNPGIRTALHEINQPEAPDANSNQVVGKKSGSQFSHWTFGLTLGPDWHSVAGKAWDIGMNGGLTFTYHINHKWAIGTGVQLDKMKYNAKPEDYHPSSDTWRNYNVKSIFGNCLVVDVPLNVEYTLWENPASGIYIAGGLSSFWMNKEKYTYYYKTSAGSWDQWSKEVYNQNYHILSIFNFSPGYVRQWNHLSLGIAPYIKIPLSGIGYGKVRLYSAGIHFTFRYNLR